MRILKICIEVDENISELIENLSKLTDNSKEKLFQLAIWEGISFYHPSIAIALYNNNQIEFYENEISIKSKFQQIPRKINVDDIRVSINEK